jgi:hypothetical protein
MEYRQMLIMSQTCLQRSSLITANPFMKSLADYAKWNIKETNSIDILAFSGYSAPKI